MKSVKTIDWITGVLWVLTALAYICSLVFLFIQLFKGIFEITAYTVLTGLLTLSILSTWILFVRDKRNRKKK